MDMVVWNLSRYQDHRVQVSRLRIFLDKQSSQLGPEELIMLYGPARRVTGRKTAGRRFAVKSSNLTSVIRPSFERVRSK